MGEFPVTKLHCAILAGCSVLALAGCGADDVVAPNGNVIVNPTPTPTPGTPTPTPGAISAAPASACTAGTTAGAVITLQGTRGTVRECILQPTITGTLALTAKRSDGIMYAINGRTDVGTDIDSGGTAANLNVSPGVTIFAKTRESSIIVNRGSKLNASGTATLPIIFTAEANLTGSFYLPAADVLVTAPRVD
jgi:hypothetical protein